MRRRRRRRNIRSNTEVESSKGVGVVLGSVDGDDVFGVGIEVISRRLGDGEEVLVDPGSILEPLHCCTYTTHKNNSVRLVY